MDVRGLLEAFDRGFAAGDAEAFSDMFAEDAQLLLLHREPIDGRPAIRERWRSTFSEHDTSAWQTEWRVVDVHDDRACALAFYSETLVPRHGGPSQLVNGRLILFLRREPDGRWLVTTLMNSHSRPIEKLDS